MLKTTSIVVAIALVCALTGSVDVRTVKAHSSVHDRSTWMANSGADVFLRYNDTMFVGGDFTQVGPYTGHAVPVDTTSAIAAASYPLVDGTVMAIESDGSGGWYIGGLFTEVGGVSRANLAHIEADGSVDTAWQADTDDSVSALALSGSTLYVGGLFTTIDGQSRDAAAALDTSGNPTAFDPGTNSGQVNVMVPSGSVVYMGGNFSFAGGGAANDVVAIDPLTSAKTAWNPGGTGGTGQVNDILVDGSTIYIAGTFASMGGSARDNVGAVDDVVGTATAWNPDTNSQVNALAMDGSTVYLGGSFTSLNSGAASRQGVAAVNNSDGTATSWNPSLGGLARDLELSGTTLYIAGTFKSIGSFDRQNVAAVTTGGTITPWNPCASTDVYRLRISGTTAYLGGTFMSVNGVTRNGLAQLDENGVPTSWDAGLNSGASVSELSIGGSTLYVGGVGISSAGGQARTNAAAFDLASANVTAWAPDPDATVGGLLVDGSTVYIGGQFANVGGAARTGIGAVSASTGMATSWNPGSNGSVTGLVKVGSTIYASGAFTSMGGAARTNLAGLDPSTGLATSWNPAPAGGVSAMDTDGSVIYVGGSFTSVGGAGRNRIAALDPTSGLATSWNPNASFFVFSLQAGLNGTVLAAGLFNTIGGATRPGFAELDATTGLATDFTPLATVVGTAVGMNEHFLAYGGSWGSVAGEEWFGSAFFPVTSVAFGVASESVVEVDATRQINVAISQADADDVTVSYAVSGGTATPGSDYDVTPGSLTFTPGQTTMTIPITVRQDFEIEGSETVKITLSNVSTNAVLADPIEYTLTITDDDDVVTRFDTAQQKDLAIQISQRVFSQAGSADALVLSRADVVVDSLTATPLATQRNATLLLSDTGSLAPEVLAEAQRALGNSAKPVFVAGGEQALSSAVVDSLKAAGFTDISRLNGIDRRDTARLVAESIDAGNSSPTTKVYLSEDRAFADALGVGAVASLPTAGSTSPILLTTRRVAALDGNVDAYLRVHPEVTAIELVGGTTALSDKLIPALQDAAPQATITRTAGETRFETSAELAKKYFTQPDVIVIASGEQSALLGARVVAASPSASFFSALLAGRLAAEFSGPLLLTAANDLPDAIIGYITDHVSTIDRAFIVGSEELVGANVEAELRALL
jgi:putative cell wall-binding protein